MAEIEALAKVKESEVKAMEDMVEFMKEIDGGSARMPTAGRNWMRSSLYRQG